MPGKCEVVKCNGNYKNENKCHVFKSPRIEHERQSWINVIPPRENFEIDPFKFIICERHWPKDTPSPSCLPTHKSEPRQPKEEDKLLDYLFNLTKN